MSDDRIERVARAIYMTHWRLPPEAMRGLTQPAAPVWEDASESVRDWVRAQAVNAVAEADRP